jgi:nitric-oxide synthase
LSREDSERLAEQAVVVEVPAGERILREGDVGDRMFVVQKGAVQVFTTSFDGSDLVLERLEAGQCFGEQALLPGGTGRRTASVRALEDCTLLELTREALAVALNENGEFLRRMQAARNEQRVARNEKLRAAVFASLGVIAQSESYRLETYAAGETVFREGERGERVYLLLKGRALVKHTANGAVEVLAELLPGQFFGELAILNDSPRAATIEAAEDLEVASLDGEWFRAAHRESPALQSLMESLSDIYLLPQRGLLTLQSGHVDGESALTAIYHLPDGRRVLCAQLAKRDAFTARVLGVEEPGESVKYEKPERGLHRELRIVAGRLVEIDAEGEWTRLGKVLEALLDAQPVADWQVTMFREKGDFQAEPAVPRYEESEIICACTQTSCGQILEVIRDQGHTVEAIGRRTGATRVCGGCTPLVKELLGRGDWTPACVCETISLSEDVRAFRIRPTEGKCPSWLPGQHLVLQARIDNRWVQRSYTLSSPSGIDDAYEITVKREPQGVFSRWLFDRLTPQAFLRISQPDGHYFLPADQQSDVVCIVAGIGVTPALAMARALVDNPRPFRLHVDYSVSEAKQLILSDELRSFQVKNPRLSVRTRITREEGRIGAADVQELVRQFPDAVFFLCGSDGFMASVKGHLRDGGMPEERIKIEVFTVAGAKPPAKPAGQATCPFDHQTNVVEQPQTPIEQAEALLRQYYTEVNAAAVFEQRWRQVAEEFRTRGTYMQTGEELAYLAKVAWRNSTRCIGRMYWEGMAVRDFRHATTADEMLEAILGHIEFATNGGNIRPTMTVFRPLGTDGKGPRVWSPQLFRYAGYRAADGSVLGDPANLELTEVATALGWQPPERRSRFDLLPLIVQTEPGQRPHWREIPRRLVLEVAITHPDFPWFADLGLKWYAVPAVSSMLFDAAGVLYAAAPFNGWYMGTEIGARNFGDSYRYNLLAVVGRKMGLDMSSDRTLWRDRALVELNVAVLYSYEKAGVTMMDHHAASHSFDKFEQLENAAGRTVHARWNWIVPPISGSAVTIFHRDSWKDIQLKPCYTHQSDPWKDDLSWKSEAG